MSQRSLFDTRREAERKGQVKPYIEGKGGGRGGWFVGVLKLRLRVYNIKPRRKRGS